jgi:hypothetical protein
MKSAGHGISPEKIQNPRGTVYWNSSMQSGIMRLCQTFFKYRTVGFFRAARPADVHQIHKNASPRVSGGGISDERVYA